MLKRSADREILATIKCLKGGGAKKKRAGAHEAQAHEEKQKY